MGFGSISPDNEGAGGWLDAAGLYHVRIDSVECLTPSEGAHRAVLGGTVLAADTRVNSKNAVNVGKNFQANVMVTGADGGDLGRGQKYLIRAAVGLGLTTEAELVVNRDKGIRTELAWTSLVGKQFIVDFGLNEWQGSVRVQVNYGKWWKVGHPDVKDFPINKQAAETEARIEEEFVITKSNIGEIDASMIPF